MDDDFAWDDLLDYIRDGKILPVLGQELVQADYQGRPVSLQRLLAERLAEREKLDISWGLHSELNDAVCAYLEKPKTRPADLYPRIARALRDLAPPFPIPQSLIKLAQVRPLDLFVSLTFDSLMARALDEVRYGGSAMAKEIAFSINQSTAAQGEALRERPRGVPVVFNLFGLASSSADYAIHDEDSLEFIHRLASGDVPPPDWLLSELRSRHLLILGVHLPDWLSRFILRTATRDRLMLAQRTYFIARENAAAGGTLAEFLQRFGRETRIHVYPGSASEFVDHLQQRWLERVPPSTTVSASDAAAPERPRGGIFISYGRENLDAVERLHDTIASLGGDPWFDREELSAGDYWERKILPQIQREIRLFVPVISARTVARNEGYVFREWREAIERSKKIVGRKFIVPVVVDPDYRGDLDRYRDLVDEFPSLRDLHFGRAPNGEPDEALRETLKNEIRAIHREDRR